jgi:hypothetical protein
MLFFSHGGVDTSLSFDHSLAALDRVGVRTAHLLAFFYRLGFEIVLSERLEGVQDLLLVLRLVLSYLSWLLRILLSMHPILETLVNIAVGVLFNLNF